MVPVEQIQVGKRHRVQKDVTELKASIQQNGLLSPITITSEFALVAGAGRLRAYQELRRAAIPAFIRPFDDLGAELVEISENLHRNDLTVLEQSEHLARYQEILAEQGLRAKRGDNQHTSVGRESEFASSDVGEILGEVDNYDGSTGTVTSVSPKTTAELAKEAGFNNPRSLQQRKQIAALPQEIRDLVRGTDLDDHLNGLLSLVALDETERLAVAETIAAGKAKSIGDAKRYLAGPVEKPPVEDGPGTDVAERYKVVTLEGALKWPMHSWMVRTRHINGEERSYPREDEWLERDLILKTDEQALDDEEGLEYLAEDFKRQFKAFLVSIGYPRRSR